MECGPTDKVESDRVAEPLVIVAVPSTVEPSRNCTVPVAVLGVTAAVRVTFCPLVEGLGEEANATLDVTLLTACIKMAELLAASVASALWQGVMESGATARSSVE